MNVWVLSYSVTYGENDSGGGVSGVYSSEGLAREAVPDLKRQLGYILDDIEIEEFEIDTIDD